MLFKISLLMLGLWLVGVSGLVAVGQAIHVFLLVGIMLLLLSLLRSRDEVARQARNGPTVRS